MTTRTRTRNTLTTVVTPSLSQNYVGTPVYGPSGQGPYGCYPMIPSGAVYQHYAPAESQLGTAETISDEEPQFKGFGNCSHDKRLSTAYPVVDAVRFASPYYVRPSWNSTQKYLEVGEVMHGSQPYYDLVAWANVAVGNTDILTKNLGTIGSGGRSDDRLHELVPRVMSRLENIHGANMLWELREFPSLWKMFKKRQALHMAIVRIRDYAQGQRLKFGTKWFLRDVYRGMSDGILNYNFGIMPTIGDSRDLARELASRKKFKSSFRVSIRDTNQIQKSGSRFVSSYGQQTADITERCDRVFGAYVKYKSSEDEYMTAAFQQLDDFNRRFIGLNPLSTVWEAIPFSFAVDWMLSVDKALDSFFLQNNARVNATWWSSESRNLTRTWTTQICTGYLNKGPHLQSASVTPIGQYGSAPPLIRSCSRYTRTVRGAPSPLSSLRPRAGLKQAFLGALIALGYRR